ncbi:unnamed protein product [Dracunculus medinensis]|uniref:MICOS complex subunit MIC60 n=1 Tax=Dracunculus medinensis TaxID=318479 RepID=A0A3P7Q159_DRAME|nr:unnamed protein product [Dracunculus medinensis]
MIGYALYNPSFQEDIKKYIPQSQQLFDKINQWIPAEREEKRGISFGEYFGNVSSGVKNWISNGKKTSEKEGNSFLKIPSLPPLANSKKVSADVEPVDIRKVPKEINVNESFQANERLNERLSRNKELEEKLKSALSAATNKVHKASDAKFRTLPDWNKVIDAASKIELINQTDKAEEFSARNYIDNVRKIVGDAKQSETTQNNPLLIYASETVHKLNQQLDELNSLISQMHNESMLLSQYKDLIKKSRHEFAKELKKILPHIDTHAKDSKLTEDELNALIAHAHLRVNELKRQLAEQQAKFYHPYNFSYMMLSFSNYLLNFFQVQEERNIAKAIEQQRNLDIQLAEDQLTRKIKEIAEESDLKIEKKVAEDRLAWETELEDRLRRAAAAHSEHLEQVVRTQRQLFDIEHNQKIQEALSQERDLHGRQINVAHGRLEGIEAALKSRTAADLETRRTKHIWIACQNLVDSVIYGRRGGIDAEARKKPLASELQVIKEVSDGDDFVSCLLEALSNECIYEGVYTEDDLKARFRKVYKLCRRVSKIDENGGGLVRYLWSYLQNAVSLDLPQNFSDMDLIDPATIDTSEILARTKYFMDKNDLASAIRIAQLLKGEPENIAKGWIRDVRKHLEARLIAELLVTHATITNIRAVY